MRQSDLERYLRSAPDSSLYSLLGFQERDRKQKEERGKEVEAQCLLIFAELERDFIVEAATACWTEAEEAERKRREAAEEAERQRREAAAEVERKEREAAEEADRKSREEEERRERELALAIFQSLEVDCIYDVAVEAERLERTRLEEEAEDAKRQKQLEENNRVRREQKWAADVAAAEDPGDYMQKTIERVQKEMEVIVFALPSAVEFTCASFVRHSCPNKHGGFHHLGIKILTQNSFPFHAGHDQAGAR